MSDQTNLNSGQLHDLLERIRRINVMLWAFDYPAADVELRAISRDFGSALDAAQEQESTFRKVKYQVEEGERNRIRNQLTSDGLAGERLQVQVQREIINRTSEALRHVEFEPTAMSLSALSAIILSFHQRVEQAKQIAPQDFNKLYEKRVSAKMLHYGRFLHAVEKRSDTHTIFRAYRLGEFSVLSIQQLQDMLQREFESSEWRILSATPSFPYKFRTFLSNAMATLVVYDQERYRLEITHDRDDGNRISDDIAARIQKVMNSAS